MVHNSPQISGFDFEESPSKVPHQEIRDRLRNDPSKEVYLMFATPGAVQPTPPGLKLLCVPKDGCGVRPKRKELLQQLESYMYLSTNVHMASADSIKLLGDRLSQRVRYLFSKCQEFGEMAVPSIAGAFDAGNLVFVTYKKLIFFSQEKRLLQRSLCRKYVLPPCLCGRNVWL
ncbi:hypothetical protein GOP47_0006822 [Adiantum capillus-veneris]|uniref:Uncharacterized protein n=1 Tax=Adiantum capillus-veneris TaxID=13818 RepID=A0A9D4ZMV4_ADICA|nr:hypothetical protein GOP47_0006822 [Adiantum capillus-veneris]